MNRWIDKLISRHFEPEQNVKPLLGGMFYGVHEGERSLEEEGMGLGVGEDRRALGNEGMVPEDEEKSLRKSLGEEGKMGEGKKVLGDEERSLTNGKTVSGGDKVKTIWEEKKVDPVRKERSGSEAVEASGRRKEEKEIDTEKIGERVLQEFRDLSPLPASALALGKIKSAGSRLVDGGLEREQAPVEKEVRYVTREAPVLGDPGEGVSMAQASGKESSGVPGGVMNASREAQPRQTIHVSIGRIEIKVVAPPPETKAAPVKKDTEVIGLDRFLEQRNPAKR